MGVGALFGTKDKDCMMTSLQSLMAIVGRDKINGLISTLKAINPAGELEGMLALQMVGVHHLTMEMMSRASSSNDSNIVKDHLNRVTKLSRTFIAQLKALNKHRGKGQQKMTVEHVHVNEGGQAVIGNVREGGSEKK